MFGQNFKKLATFTFVLSSAFLMGCSESNPIEIEGQGTGVSVDLNDLEKELQKSDYYSCEQKYGSERCTNFNKVYGSYNTKEIADENYNDKAEYIGPASSDSNPSSSEVTPYLQKNMSLKITLKSYKQVIGEISENDPVGDPNVRFAVKLFSDGVQVRMAESEEYTVTPVLLNEMNVQEWSGNKSTSIMVTRGIDEVHLCPIVVDMDEEDSDVPEDKDISSGECYVIKDLGYLSDLVDMKDSSKLYEITWQVELY